MKTYPKAKWQSTIHLHMAKPSFHSSEKCVHIQNVPGPVITHLCPKTLLKY